LGFCPFTEVLDDPVLIEPWEELGFLGASIGVGLAPVVLVGFGANFVVAYIFPVGEFGSIGAVLSVLFTDTCVIVVVVGGGLTHVEQT
jgi:hypothetical protein